MTRRGRGNGDYRGQGLSDSGREAEEYDHALQDRGEPPAERGDRALRVAQAGDEEPLAIAAAPSAVSAVSAPPPPVVPEKSLEEIEELHLRDSFWTV